MAWIRLAYWDALIVAGAFFVGGLVRLGWRAAGIWRIHRAGPRRLRSTRHRIWRDPGRGGRFGLRHGPGGPEGAPVPPVTLLSEYLTGPRPCVATSDGRR